MATPQECLKAYRKAGCLDLAADMLDLPKTHVTRKIRAYLQNTGQNWEWMSRDHQVQVINKYMDRPYYYISRLIGQPTFDELAVCNVDGVIKYMRPNKIEGDLIGVYDKHGNANQRREDIYWYVINHMETNDA